MLPSQPCVMLCLLCLLCTQLTVPQYHPPQPQRFVVLFSFWLVLQYILRTLWCLQILPGIEFGLETGIEFGLEITLGLGGSRGTATLAG